MLLLRYFFIIYLITMPFDNFNNNITLDDYCDKNDFLYGESINSHIESINKLLK